MKGEEQRPREESRRIVCLRNRDEKEWPACWASQKPSPALQKEDRMIHFPSTLWKISPNANHTTVGFLFSWALGAGKVDDMAWWKAWVEQEGVSVKGSPHFNPDPDAETLYKAMKGIGTNEQAIIDVLTKRSNAQRQQIAKSFKAQFGKDLIETLKSELSGKFERLIIALMYPPYRYEAKELYDAMKGIGTKEGVIIEILASRTKNQLQEIMKAYEEDYGSNLEEDIKADTSGYLERILVCLLQGSRDDLSGYVDPGLALQDAQDLYAAGEKICGTDEMKFITILCTRSATHLLRVFEEYEKIANKSIEDSIKSETHGSLEEAMLTVVKCTRNLHSYFAERLYFAMKGAGTLDGTLIRNIVSRSEIDLNLIKNQFKKMYGKTLSSMIMEDTSGDYKNALLNLVGSDL
ncbi:hypothetical protein R6Z07F_019341 [Ovis aries]